MMRHAVALTTSTQDAAKSHLVRADGQEDLCFALWNDGHGRSRRTALIQELILPVDGDRNIHGNASINPQYLERALSEARSAGAGLCLMHSHPYDGWQGMSPDDVNTEKAIAAAAFGATGLPLLGMTLGTDGAWSARRWERVGTRQYDRVWCDRVRVTGDYVAMTYHPTLAPVPATGEELDRTISAWGPEVQADLTRMVVGVVGLGSVGSIVGEALARMGFTEVYLIDFDSVERVNRDRILHAKEADVLRAKVRMLGEAFRLSATAESFEVHEVEYSVTEEEGYRAALDCDLLFSCVDRPWGRSVLNAIAFAHLIPVIDGGIRAEPMRGMRGLRRADMRGHVVTAGRACLECVGQYDSAFVAMERDGYLDNPSYIAGLSPEDRLRQKQNVFAFSLSTAGFQIAQMISLVARPLGISNPGGTVYHLVTNALEAEYKVCGPNCLYPSYTAKGSAMDAAFIGSHPGAERERAKRAYLAVVPPPVNRGFLQSLLDAIRL